ncbi:DUF1694 domain-containing protein [Isachenkonia alkalipeptolytica]|uniref:DUF1694 domain-containing protein n=1 Tax=Isachenkonia alkalipeptolytica TaxID=2565777 RepID=A0AA43XLW6_9CLOT|nr:DUF1694 domain-containing protein [Isachenkonia alkalipeptolytica]NBG88325.1 DUF1694 domain-containing protein [Isachenkonia alkalipeptolytica]
MKDKNEKSELEQTLQRGIYGPPIIKGEEKKVYLGEFRERVIVALSPEEVFYDEGVAVAEEALQDAKAHRLIVNHNKLTSPWTKKYMGLARKYNKEYKSFHTQAEEAMGLVVVSREAVNRENIRVKLRLLPDKFQHAEHKKLCKDCYEELENAAPDRVGDFKKLGLMDKLLGKTCGVPEEEHEKQQEKQ